MVGKQHFFNVYHYLIFSWSLTSSYSYCVASLWPYLPLFPFIFVSTPSKPNLCSGAWTSESDGDQQQQWRRHPLLAQQYCQCWARTHQPCNSMAGGEPLVQGYYPLQSEYLLYQSAEPKPPGHQRHFPRWWEHRCWHIHFLTTWIYTVVHSLFPHKLQLSQSLAEQVTSCDMKRNSHLVAQFTRRTIPDWADNINYIPQTLSSAI